MNKKLENLRAIVDEVDSKIINLIYKRAKLVKKIKNYKEKKNMVFIDKVREKKIYRRLKKLAKDKKLNEDLIKKLFRLLVRYYDRS